MSACADFKEDLSAYLDGELDAGRQSELTEHLEACPPCQGQQTQMRQTVSLLAQAKLSAYAKCPDLWSGISSKLPTVCQTIEADFSAYLDGELIVPAKEGVSEHLQLCKPCHGKFQDLSQVNGLLSRGLALDKTLEIDIWSQIKNRLDEDCLLIKDELSSFYDREVSAQRHRTITGHLLDCANCRDALSNIAHTGDLLRDSYQPEIPEEFDLWPEIKAKMQVVQFPKEKKRKESPWAKPKSLQLLAASAAVAAGLVAAVTGFMNTSAINVKPVTAESYLIESALGEPANVAEAMVYENQ